MKIMLVAAILCLGAVSSFGNDWVTNPTNLHQYTVVNASDWQMGETQAVALGGHLTTIRSASENNWLLQNVLMPTNKIHAYIGLYQLPGSIEPNQGWVWVSGEPVSYTNWNSRTGEPNNVNGNENWANICGDTGGWGEIGVWNDINPDNGLVPSIAIVEIVPEPSSIIAIITGLGSLLVFRRNK